jgi:hypothetical protein
MKDCVTSIRQRLTRLTEVLAATGVVAILGLTVAHCKKKNSSKAFQTSEPKHNLKKLAEGAKGYFEKGAVVGRTGKVKKPQFPSTIPLFPATKCCKQKDKMCQPSAKGGSFGKNPAMVALGFDIIDPHDYQYRIISSGTAQNAKFKIQAVADPGCNGKYLVFEIEGSAGNEMRVNLGKITTHRNVTQLD